jgi:hypothetical protein
MNYRGKVQEQNRLLRQLFAIIKAAVIPCTKKEMQAAACLSFVKEHKGTSTPPVLLPLEPEISCKNGNN